MAKRARGLLRAGILGLYVTSIVSGTRSCPRNSAPKPYRLGEMLIRLIVHRLRYCFDHHASCRWWNRLRSNGWRQPARRRKRSHHGRYCLSSCHDGNLHHPHHRLWTPSGSQQKERRGKYWPSWRAQRSQVLVLPCMLSLRLPHHFHPMRVPVSVCHKLQHIRSFVLTL